MNIDELESQILHIIEEIEDKINDIENDIIQLKNELADTQQAANTLKSEI